MIGCICKLIEPRTTSLETLVHRQNPASLSIGIT